MCMLSLTEFQFLLFIRHFILILRRTLSRGSFVLLTRKRTTRRYQRGKAEIETRGFLDQQDPRSIGTRGTDRYLRGRPIGRSPVAAKTRPSGFFCADDDCAIRGGSRATELPKHASALPLRENQPRRAPSSV